MKDKNKKIVDIIFRDKPYMVLLVLYDKEKAYASNLAKSIDCTYSHIVKILNEFCSAGLIEFNKSGRIKEVKLTKKGKEVAKNMKCLVDTLLS